MLIRGSCSPRSRWRTPRHAGPKPSYHRRRSRALSGRWVTNRASRRSRRSRPGTMSRCTALPAPIEKGTTLRAPGANFWRFRMRLHSRSLIVAALAVCATAAAPAFAAKDVVFAVASTFTTTDPYDANDTLSQAMAKSFYEGLYGFDKDMKMIPVLAESYEVSKDGLTYTVKLKKGIKFHDGTDFNAAAVKANFDRVTNPDNKLKRYGLYSNIGKTE